MIKYDDHTVILLVGESGSGKTTVANILEQKYGLNQLISYTTRERRGPDDKSHIFVDKDHYDGLHLVATTYYDGNYYGASEAQIDMCHVYAIDPAGIESLHRLYRGNKKFLTIYLDTAEDVRIERMRNRGDSEEQIKARLKQDKKSYKTFSRDAYRLEGIIPVAADCMSGGELADLIYDIYRAECEKDNYEENSN